MVSDLSIPLEDNQLSAARSIVFEYATTLEDKKQKNKQQQGNLTQPPPDEAIVFLGRNPDTPASEQPPTHVVQAIERLWKSPQVQQAYQRRNEFQLGDSADYFLNNVSKFTADNFVPSNQDILKARVRTQSIVKVNETNKAIIT